MLANLLHIAGVKHVITVDLHASQMQGFFRCPVDNLHAEPLIARWIRDNVPNWSQAAVVSKNAGGTKRVTSLADALKLNFGMVTTDRKRNGNMSASMIMNHLDGYQRQPALEDAPLPTNGSHHAYSISEDSVLEGSAPAPPPPPAPGQQHQIVTGSHESPIRSTAPSRGQGSTARSPYARPFDPGSGTPYTAGREQGLTIVTNGLHGAENVQYYDGRVNEVTHGRLVQGHIVPDDFASPTTSAAGTSIPEEDPMMMSHASSFFSPGPHALGGSGDAGPSDDEEVLTNPAIEHMITLVGDVRGRTVFIIDDMIDKPGSWIAAAETVYKRGNAKKVYCIATHAVFGGDCLEQLQACECIDQIVVTNSFPIDPEKARNASKLIVLDLSYLLSEAIRRNHYGESIHPLFQHITD